MKIRVLCVDDSQDIVEMLGRCIDAEPDMECVGTRNCADDLSAVVARTRADVVILDMTMLGRDPLAALKELAQSVQGGCGADAGQGGRVIAYSGRDDAPAVESAAEAGAWGYVSKDTAIPRVLEAIRDVARGRTVFGVAR